MMDKYRKRAITDRLESWGEWYWRKVYGIGYSDKSTVASFQDTGVGESKTSWKKQYQHTPAQKRTSKPIIPGYKASEYNSIVHQFILSLEELPEKIRTRLSLLIYYSYAYHHSDAGNKKLMKDELWRACGMKQDTFHKMKRKLFELFEERVGI